MMSGGDVDVMAVRSALEANDIVLPGLVAPGEEADAKPLGIDAICAVEAPGPNGK